MIKSKGYDLTGSYVQVYNPTNSSMVELHNETTTSVQFIVGEQALDDANSITLDAGKNWYSEVRLDGPLFVKGTGKVIVVADQP